MESGFLWCLVLAACLWSVRGQDRPSITEIIWPDVKRIGMSAYLNCTVSRQQLNKLFWIRKSDQTILTSDDRVQVDNSINEMVNGQTKFDVRKRPGLDRTTYTLVVRRLVLSDAGTYTCQLRMTGAAVNPSKDGQIVVLIPPTIRQGDTTQTVSVREGGSVNLTCAATGYPAPNISWVRVNGSPLPSPYNRFSVKGSMLQLSNLKASDRGMYRCVADNNVRPLATYDTSVYVEFKPVSRPLQLTYGQASNRLFDLIIDCIVSGYPAPDLSWFKVRDDGRKIRVITDDKHVINQMLSHGQQLSMSEIWYQMTIINVQANDYGRYVCQGANRHGTSEYTIQVYETSECQGPNCPLEGGTASSGNQLTMPTLWFLSPLWLLATSVFLMRSSLHYEVATRIL